jgi:hypothetical protein
MTKQISPLRQRMIDDMTIHNMSPSTHKVYVRAVANFSIFHGRSPDKLTFEDVRDYRLHLISRGLKAASNNPIMGALRFFYGTTLGQKQASEQIPYARRADTLPAVLARDEAVRFLKAVPNLKMRTAFITIYAAGLRVSEAARLTGRLALSGADGPIQRFELKQLLPQQQLWNERTRSISDSIVRGEIPLIIAAAGFRTTVIDILLRNLVRNSATGDRYDLG